jgi:hypothetical protein
MNRGEIRIVVDRDPFSAAVRVFIGRSEAGRLFLARPVELIMEEVPHGQISEPTLNLAGDFGNALLRAVAEMLDKEGIKTEKHSRIEGTLEATSYHLEDLRQILKNKGYL